jgi:hypothetical protein
MDNLNDREMPDWVKNLLTDEDIFWNQKYPLLTKEEKIRHWSGTLHRQMRWNAESGYDPYAIYSPEKLIEITKVENNFIEFLEIIFNNHWKGQWDDIEIKKRLGL